MESRKKSPSMDEWLREAKASPLASECGMFLFHNGIVRETSREKARNGREDALPVKGMIFSYDAKKAASARENALNMPGIKYVKVWLNEGELHVGDDIMFVLIGGDIRPRVVDALQVLVSELKSECVTEKEIF